MFFHSTNKKSKNFRLPEVLLLGLAPDGGLFLPENFPKLPADFFSKIQTKKFNNIAFTVIKNFLKEIPEKELKRIIKETFNFSIPLRLVSRNLYVLELFHGPTLAFKDFGARFLARILGYFSKGQDQTLNIIVATSGDTGSAVASGFLKVPGIRVFILYPFGKVSPLQEKQLTTYGHNIIAMEVRGTFDDCQKLAKQVLSDSSLGKKMKFSSANSINFGRLLPQSLYYFWAVRQLQKRKIKGKPVFVVPSGNFGNLFAGLMAKRMGLPVFKFVAATNSNDVVPKFLQTGKFQTKKSKKTLSNAMDVGNPSNFARMLYMYHNSHKQMAKEVVGVSIGNKETKQTIKNVYKLFGYVCDPHTAVGMAAAEKFLKKGNAKFPIVVLSTAHPAKFREIVEPVIGKTLNLPWQLKKVLKKKKQAIEISKKYQDLKKVLLSYA